jgi:hypothetical protein
MVVNLLPMNRQRSNDGQSAYGKFPTLEEASVKLSNGSALVAVTDRRSVVFTYLLSVVDFPLEGFPTIPMRGSRGIAGLWRAQFSGA